MKHERIKITEWMNSSDVDLVAMFDVKIKIVAPEKERVCRTEYQLEPARHNQYRGAAQHDPTQRKGTQ